MNQKIAKAIILNLGDGLTTSLSYLLPMVLFGGHFQGKTLIIGGIGGGVSMALNLDDSENGEGSPLETATAFVSAVAGALLPVIPFLVFRKGPALVGCLILVICIVVTLVGVKSQIVGTSKAIKQTLSSLIPAMVIVSLLSLL